MPVKRGKLEFHNVIGRKVSCPYGEWEEKAQEFRTILIRNDLFITGPIIIQWEAKKKETDQAELTMYLPLHKKVDLPENESFFFLDKLECKDGIKIRHNDMEDEIEESEEMLRFLAKKAKLIVKEPFYCIYLPVFGEYVVDIYAEVVGGGIV